MLTKYHQLSSSLKVRQVWITKFPGANPPHVKTIMCNVNKLQKTDSNHNLPHCYQSQQKGGIRKNQLTDMIHILIRKFF